MCDATEGASAWSGEAAPRPSFCLCSDHTLLQSIYTRWVVPLFLRGWAGHTFVLMEWPCFAWAPDKELLYSFRMVASV